VVIFFGSLMPKVNLGQSIKLSELVSHYYEHKRAAPDDFDLWDFLVMHYSADSAHAKTKHPTLPSFDINGMGYLYLLPAVISFSRTSDVTITTKEDHFSWLNNYFFAVGKTLLNPPRF
jgi:hypothetical protein